MCQSVLCGKGDELLAIIAAYAASPGAKPEIPLSIFYNGPHVIMRQPVVFGEGDELLAIIAAHAASIGPKP